MPRPFTRAQAHQNQAFLKALRRTGNARLSARELGMHGATFTRRRARHPAFAAEWDAAPAIAHAALQRNGETEPEHVRWRRGECRPRPDSQRLIVGADPALLSARGAGVS